MVQWIVRLMPHGDATEVVTFQSVRHNWCNRGHGMWYPVCGIVHVKDPLLLIIKSAYKEGSMRFL